MLLQESEGMPMSITPELLRGSPLGEIEWISVTNQPPSTPSKGKWLCRVVTCGVAREAVSGKRHISALGMHHVEMLLLNRVYSTVQMIVSFEISTPGHSRCNQRGGEKGDLPGG